MNARSKVSQKWILWSPAAAPETISTVIPMKARLLSVFIQMNDRQATQSDTDGYVQVSTAERPVTWANGGVVSNDIIASFEAAVANVTAAGIVNSERQFQFAVDVPLSIGQLLYFHSEFGNPTDWTISIGLQLVRE